MEALMPASPSSVSTPTRGPLRTLSDRTNTPPPPTEPRRLVRHDDDVGTLGTAVVQRYSLKSRRVGSKEPQGSENTGSCKVASELLWTTPQFNTGSAGPVRICPCSLQAEGTRLGCSVGFEARRLCQKSTEDHCEYRLLELMSRSFGAECGHTLRQSTDSLAAMASMQQLEAYFIVEPMRDLIVGYVAIRPTMSNNRKRRYTPTLEEVFVDRDFRQRGMATAALRVLLASESSVALGKTPSHAVEPMRRLLRGLGFSECGSSVFARPFNDDNSAGRGENAL